MCTFHSVKSVHQEYLYVDSDDTREITFGSLRLLCSFSSKLPLLALNLDRGSSDKSLNVTLLLRLGKAFFSNSTYLPWSPPPRPPKKNIACSRRLISDFLIAVLSCFPSTREYVTG